MPGALRQVKATPRSGLVSAAFWVYGDKSKPAQASLYWNGSMKHFALKLIHRSPRVASVFSMLPSKMLVSNITRPYRLASFFFLLKDYKKTKEILSQLPMTGMGDVCNTGDIRGIVLFRVSLGLVLLGEMEPSELKEKFKHARFSPPQLRAIADSLFYQIREEIISFNGSSEKAKEIYDAFSCFFSHEKTGSEIAFREVLNLLETTDQPPFAFDELIKERTYSFSDPIIWGREAEPQMRQVTLPHFGMYEISNAKIREGCSVYKDQYFLLYDLGGHPKHGRTAGTSFCFWKANQTGEYGFENTPISRLIKIDKAILISGRSTANYYHWLTEYLPKMMVFKHFPEKLKNATIIIDRNMPKQHLSALHMVMKFVGAKNEIYMRKVHEEISVKKFFLPTNPTVISEGFDKPWWVASGVSPEHLLFIRKAILSRMQLSEKPSGNRKIIISRPGQAARSIVNLPEIEELLVSHGYERAYPERLSFEEQVKLFNSAEVIFAPGGAALANLLFCGEGAKVFAMVSERNADYAGHKNVAMTAKLNYVHITGQNIKPRSAFPSEEYFVHSSFSIPIEKIKTALR